MNTIRRTLTWFDKRIGELVGQTTLKGVSLPELRRIFHADRKDPMYESFPVKPEQVCKLQRFADATICLNHYDYFVEAEAVSDPGEKDFFGAELAPETTDHSKRNHGKICV